MRLLAKGLVRGKGLYQEISPAWPKVFKVCKIKRILLVVKAVSIVKKYHKAKSINDVVGIFSKGLIKGVVFGNIGKGIERVCKKTEVTRRPIININGRSSKTWIDGEIDQNRRVVKRMRVVFHHATNPHLDIHIGHLSLIINIGGKSIMNDIKFNKSGELTEKSKMAIMNFLREEVMNNSRMAQNADHSIRNAETSWNVGEAGIKGYGSGLTRQTVVNKPVEIMSVDNGDGKTIKMYCPTLNKHRLLYLHKLYHGDNKKAPIVTWGVIKKPSPSFGERLNLKSDKDLKSFLNHVDSGTVTLKYDGAGVHFSSGSKETTFWSPRVSIETGDRIQYTGKLPELYRIKREDSARGMGELVFYRRFNIFRPFKPLTLTAAETGGILNSDKIRPLDILPLFVVYRMDKWNSNDVSNLQFFDNRKLQEAFSKLSDFVRPPEIVPASEFKHIINMVEGFVGVPMGKGINEGRKHTTRAEAYDWQVESVNLKWGPKGKVAGVIWFRSLDSGKQFKLGPGQIGKENECVEFMRAGDNLIGMVAKIRSKRGHEGRSAKLVEWHLDRGVG